MNRRLTFVAMGDSLTAGYQSPVLGEDWTEPAPYTRFLAEMTGGILSKKDSVDFHVEFLNRGVVGELTEDMLQRFETDVIDLEPDFVIILGGSNDIGWHFLPKLILKNLSEMYDEASAHQITPLGCTVPSVLGFDEGIGPRLELNSLIKTHCMDRGFPCIDLFTATCDPETQRLRVELSNDGLHLNTGGYMMLARTVFDEAIRQIVTEFLGRIH